MNDLDQLPGYTLVREARAETVETGRALAEHRLTRGEPKRYRGVKVKFNEPNPVHVTLPH